MEIGPRTSFSNEKAGWFALVVAAGESGGRCSKDELCLSNISLSLMLLEHPWTGPTASMARSQVRPVNSRRSASTAPDKEYPATPARTQGYYRNPWARAIASPRTSSKECLDSVTQCRSNSERLIFHWRTKMDAIHSWTACSSTSVSSCWVMRSTPATVGCSAPGLTSRRPARC